MPDELRSPIKHHLVLHRHDPLPHNERNDGDLHSRRFCQGMEDRAALVCGEFFIRRGRHDVIQLMPVPVRHLEFDQAPLLPPF